MLVSALPALQVLTLAQTWVQLHDSLLHALTQHCTDLRVLVASPQSEGATEYGLALTDAGLLSLTQGCRRLETLSVHCEYGIDVSLALAGLPALRCLIEEGTMRTSRGGSRKGHSRTRAGAGAGTPSVTTSSSGSGESSVEVLDIRSGILLTAAAFNTHITASGVLGPRLLRLSVGPLSAGKGSPDPDLPAALAVALQAAALPALEVLSVPSTSALDCVILSLLAEQRLPSLRSWTRAQHTSTRGHVLTDTASIDRRVAAAAANSSDAWTVARLDCLSRSGPCDHLKQLSVTGAALTPAWMRALSRAFPSLLRLSLDGYTLPVDLVPSSSAALLHGELLATFVLGFPCLRQLLLPGPRDSPRAGGSHAAPFDWLAFALFYANIRGIGGKDDDRGLYPLPALLAEAVTDGTPAWLQELKEQGGRSGLPGRLQVLWDCDLPYDLGLARLQHVHRTATASTVTPPTTGSSWMEQHGSTPFVHLLRRTADESSRPWMEERQHKRAEDFVLAALARAPPLSGALLGKSNVAATSGDEPGVDRWLCQVGEDSEDESAACFDPLAHRPHPSTALSHVHSLLRRLRRSSALTKSIGLPRVLGLRGYQKDEDVSFQYSADAVSACLAASVGNTVLTEVTVFVSTSQKNPSLLSAALVGLGAAAPTWRNLVTIKVREHSVGAEDVAALLTALAQGYEHAPATALTNVSMNVTPLVTESVVVAAARLAAATCETLTSLIIAADTPNKCASDMYTDASVTAVRAMLCGLRPNRANPAAALTYSVGGMFDDGREVMLRLVQGLVLPGDEGPSQSSTAPGKSPFTSK